jgi:virginiamycin A acetyltransferase
MTYPPFVSVGAKTYHGHLTFFRWGNETISIAKWCALSQDIKLLAGGGHRFDTVTSHPLGWAFGLNGPGIEDRSYDKPDGKGIHIGNATWIGWGVTIIGNVTVGDGAVIAANSTVFTDVPPYSLYAGNPARLQKFLFDEDQIESLLRIAWWDWPEEKIRERVDDFYLPIDEFVWRHESCVQSPRGVHRQTIAGERCVDCGKTPPLASGYREAVHA